MSETRLENVADRFLDSQFVHRPFGTIEGNAVPIGGSGDIELSVVVPCYNEEAGLRELCRRVVEVCQRVCGESYELILVNDGSKDDSSQVIADLAEVNPAIVGVELSRNHGHQLALTAGLSLARGRSIFILDADLQDPPELLPVMMEKLKSGANIVYGRRIDRQGESNFKLLTAKWFYRILGRLTDVDIPADTGDFRLVDRQALDIFLRMPEQYRFIRGMFAWIGLRQEAVDYTRDRRFEGVTKYNIGKMIGFAADAITGFSIAPLRASLYLAFFMLLATVVVATYVVYGWLTFEVAPGWASILLCFLVFSGTQLFCIAVIGEYVGRTFIQSKNRPLYMIKEIVTRASIERRSTANVVE